VKITKSQLKQIIKEEMSRVITETATGDESQDIVSSSHARAAEYAIQALGVVTRSGGQRRLAARYLSFLLEELGGDEAVDALRARVSEMPGFLDRSKE
jgi:hypothetical protein